MPDPFMEQAPGGPPPPPPPPPAAAVRTQFPFPFHRDVTVNPMHPGRVPRLSMQNLGYRFNPISRQPPPEPAPQPQPEPPAPEPEQYAIYSPREEPREERRGVKRKGDPLINDDFGPPQPWVDPPVDVRRTPLMPQPPQPLDTEPQQKRMRVQPQPEVETRGTKRKAAPLYGEGKRFRPNPASLAPPSAASPASAAEPPDTSNASNSASSQAIAAQPSYNQPEDTSKAAVARATLKKKTTSPKKAKSRAEPDATSNIRVVPAIAKNTKKRNKLK